MKKFLCVFLALFTLTLTGCGGGKEVYSGEGYELSYDPDKWVLSAEADDGLVAFRHRGFHDVMFLVDRNVVEENVSPAEWLERDREICEKNGCIWGSGEILDIDGIEWCREEYQEQIFEVNYKRVDLFTDNGAYLYAIAFMSDIDSYDQCIKDFEEVFDSFEITE